jgi:hypothetical protein
VRAVKTFAFVILSAVLAVACGKGPAQAAITTAETAVAGVQAEGSKYVPNEFKALTDSMAAAKAKFDSSDYKAALEGAQAIPAQAEAVAKAAAAKKTELTETWKALEGTLPATVAEIGKKLTELSSAKKLPAGLDKTGLDTLKVTFDGATTAWAEAGTAFGAGDLAAAVKLANQVKAASEEIMTKLGMTPTAPAAAPEAAASPAETPKK